MKIHISGLLLILTYLVTGSAQGERDYNILEDPPILVVINEASNYPYIPSNYIYAPEGFYLADTNPLGNLIPLTTSSSYCNSSQCGVSIPEKLLGGWELIESVSVWDNNCFYVYLMPYKGFTPSASDYTSHCIGNYGKIYSITPISSDLFIDTSNGDTNFILYYSPASNSTLSSCSTNFESSFGSFRTISFYMFGDKSFIYRLSSIIEVFNAEYPMNITLAYVYNKTNINSQFDPQDAQVFFGDIFVVSKADTTIYRIVPGDNVNISRINVTDTCFHLKVYYDVSYQTTSLSVILLCSTYLMRIDWTDFYSPIILESYPISNSFGGIVEGGYGTVATSNSFNLASFNGRYNLPEIAMYYRKTPIQGSLVGVTTPSNFSSVVASTIDIDQNYMITISSSPNTESAYLLQPPIYYLNSSVIQGDHELIIWIGNSSNQEIYNYSQYVFLNTSLSASTGVFYNSSAIPLVITQQTSSYYVPLHSVISLSDPISITPNDADLLNGALLNRTNSLDLELYTQSYAYQTIVTIPNLGNEIFFWFAQEAGSQDICIKQCFVTQDYQEVAELGSCNQLRNISLSANEQLVGAVAICNDSSPNNIMFGVQTTQNENLIIHIYFSEQDPLYTYTYPTNLNYGKLYSTRYKGPNQLIYCYNQDSILLWNPLDEIARNMEYPKVFNVETSPNYEDVLFIQIDTTTITILYSGSLYRGISAEYFPYLSLIFFPAPTCITSFVISEKSLIAVDSSSSFLVYDISNIRNPYLLNTIPQATGSYTSILSSGSRIFFPISSMESSQQGLFDSQLPDISQLYPLAYNNTITAMQFRNSDLVFWVNSENKLSITQFFHYLRFQVTIVQPSSYKTNSCIDLAFPQKEGFIYPLCFLIYSPMQNIARGLPTTTSWNLDLNQSTSVLQGDIFDYFIGPISGSIEVSPEHPSEINFFNTINLVQSASYNVSLSPSDQILFSTEFNGFIYLLVNTFQTYGIYQLTIDGPESNAASLMTVSVPDSIPQNWQCTSLFVSTNDTIKYWFVIPCTNLNTGEVVVIYQSMNTTLASYVTASLDTIVRARSANNPSTQGKDDCLLLLGYQAGNPTLCMYFIEAQLFCNKLGSELNSLTLNFTDFDVINVDRSSVSLQVIILEYSGGVWSVGLQVGTAPTLNYFASVTYYKFSLEYENTVPSLIGVEILNAGSDSLIAIVSEYGSIYVVTLNPSTGQINPCVQYNSYSDWRNLPSIQFSSTEMYVLSRDDGQNTTQILRYLLPSNPLDPSAPQDPFGVFPTRTPSLGGFSGGYQLWAIDENNLLNIIKISSSFTVTFVGNSSDLSSSYIDIKAYGGYQNASGVSRINLTSSTPPNPPTPTPFPIILVIIIVVVAIIVILLAYYCLKKWKARRRDPPIDIRINSGGDSLIRLLPRNDDALRARFSGSQPSVNRNQSHQVNSSELLANQNRNNERPPIKKKSIIPEPPVVNEENNRGMNQNKQEDNNLCRICFTEEKNCFFQPCLHLATCEGCSKAILEKKLKCPICRKEIMGSQRIYIV